MLKVGNVLFVPASMIRALMNGGGAELATYAVETRESRVVILE